VLVLVFMGLIVTGSIVAAVSAHRTRRRVLAWPTTPGKIVEREVIPATRPTLGTPGYRWEPRVKYSYSVGGVGFLGTRIYPEGAPIHTKDSSQKFLDALPEQVAVRYDPQDPALSCLDALPRWQVGLLTVVSVLLVLAYAGVILAKLAA
jgi:hypothetical protein